jgi:hypothetical protein
MIEAFVCLALLLFFLAEHTLLTVCAYNWITETFFRDVDTDAEIRFYIISGWTILSVLLVGFAGNETQDTTSAIIMGSTLEFVLFCFIVSGICFVKILLWKEEV